MPVELKFRPTFKGFIVPYIVVTKDGTPYFKINDTNKVNHCINNDLCSICGGKMDEDKWMVGGPASSFAQGGYFVDIPVHKECGEYALKTCPYMAYTQYTAKGVDQEKIEKLFPGTLFYNPTKDQNRLKYFVFFKIESYQAKRAQGLPYELLIIPQRPYLEIEYWRDGERIPMIKVAEYNFNYKIPYNEYNY